MAEGLKRYDEYDLVPIEVHFLNEPVAPAVQTQTEKKFESSLLDFLRNNNNTSRGGTK